MTSKLRCIVLLLALASSATAGDQPSNSKWPRIHFGGFTLTAGYTHFSGGPFYPYYGYYGSAWSGYYPGFYDPFLLAYLSPGFYRGFPYRPYTGEVKIQTKDKTAWVYLDGALAGRADKLKTIWLDPGIYNLEIREGDRKFGQRIYVLSGKTLKLTPDMLAKETP